MKRFLKGHSSTISSSWLLKYYLHLFIKYARQVAAKTLVATKSVAIKDIKKYVVIATDVPFTQMVKDLTAFGKIKSGKISLQNLVESLTDYPSAGVIEYLTDLIGPAKVDEMVKTLGLTANQTVYFTSALLPFTNYK
jgi:hypothetical protein